ncbi:MAG: type II secretion system F family protein [Clostridium sp.]|nr:type II secretion system F family protein [Clostridium sp.]
MASTKKKYLSNARIFHFFEQLGALIGAGISPYAALGIMARDADNRDIDPVLRQIGESVSEGRHLSESIAETGVFPAYVTELLNIGEQTGRLEEVCGALARYYEEEDDLRESIRSAVSYPVIMIVMMFAVVIVLVSRVLPIFAQVFRQLGASVNGVTQTLINLSETISRYYLVFAVILLIGAALFLYFYCTQKGQEQFRDLMAVFPPTKDFSESLALTRFAGGLRMTQSAGLDAYTSLELASHVAGNKTVLKKIHACRELLEQGDSFSEAVQKTGLFNPFYSGMISVFAQAGSVDRAMDFIADHYKEETDRRISRTLAAIEPTMVVILSLIVGLILLSVMLPLMGIMANIG